MKEVRLTLEDWEHKELETLKGELSWHDFLCRDLTPRGSGVVRKVPGSVKRIVGASD